MSDYSMNVIAHIHTDFTSKFGIPRQSGIVSSLEGTIVFTPEYRVEAAVRGMDGFSHLWLIWVFSESVRDSWSPTVRPPRLGGNERMGVFATRSPFRPNPIGLSCVELTGVELHPDLGPVLHVRGADLMDGTPILDIKPYIPYADAKPEAIGGFASQPAGATLHVQFSQEAEHVLDPSLEKTLSEVLSQDPRPHYQNNPDRIYGFSFHHYEVRFRVEDSVLTVLSISKE